MAENSFNPLKFEMNKPVTVELAFDSPVESFSEKFQKTNYWYGIKEYSIKGENGFNATEKLHETIQALNVKKGSKVIIQKVNNGKYTYFTVDNHELIKENDESSNTTNGDILLKDIKVETEITLESRVASLIKRVAVLEYWKKENEGKKEGKKEPVMDDDIPF